MSSNLQIITACALSLVTGLYLGHYLIPTTTPIPKKGRIHKKVRSSQSSSSSSPTSSPNGSSPSSEQTTEEDEYTEESGSEYESESDLEESEEEDYQVDSTSLNDIPGETRMALIVRQDLKMGKGKAAAQCAHAALGAYKLMLVEGQSSTNITMLKRWERSGTAKITLQVPSKEDMDLLFAKAISLNINSYIVHDAGRTQIAAGSATVLALGPAPKIILDQVTGDLKLY